RPSPTAPAPRSSPRCGAAARSSCRRASTPTEPDASRSVHQKTLGRAPRGSRLAGRRILVVWAGQRASADPDPPVGNGRAMAVLFAREGAAVACLDRVPEAAEATCAIIVRAGWTVWCSTSASPPGSRWTR
ncbi:MAG: hypothetical protein E7K72_27710, partial [Roseomonas mucosa]|nr:hypothetical protein [Roseomonas mucosa]